MPGLSGPYPAPISCHSGVKGRHYFNRQSKTENNFRQKVNAPSSHCQLPPDEIFMLALSQVSKLTWQSCSNAKETFVTSQVQKLHLIIPGFSEKLAISFQIICSVYQHGFAIKPLCKEVSKVKIWLFYPWKVMRKKKKDVRLAIDIICGPIS